MTTDNLDVVRRLFDAVEARDVEPMYEIYGPEVVIHEAASLPYGGEYLGHDGVLEHGLGYLSTWDHLQTDDDRQLDPEFTADGDRVVVCWRQRAHGRDGTRLDVPVVSVYDLEERHVLRSIMHHFDTAAVLGFLNTQR